MGKLEKKIVGSVVLMIVAGTIFANIVIFLYQKRNLLSTAQEKVFETARVIQTSIERTMLEGNARITRQMVSDLKRLKGVENIVVLNYEGREAFNKTAPKREANIIEKLKKKPAPVTILSGSSMTIYSPLPRKAACERCHRVATPIMGAVKIEMSLAKESRKVSEMVVFNISASVIAILGLSSLLFVLLRKIVINPVKEFERASRRLAEGDLSFTLDLKGDDEIAFTGEVLQESLKSLSSILNRIKEITIRVSKISSEVEAESREMLEGTKKETLAIENISSSIEQMNASIAEIADSTRALALSAEESASAIEEMSASISQIAENSNELFESVESISASIEQLGSSIKEVANSADELLQEADNTFTSTEEIASAVREVEANARQSAELSKKVMEEATTSGKESVEKTAQGMERIKISVETTAEYIKRLNSRSEEIGKILNVIDDITDQTTLLALNAAILAAQAGEHGKGFSVVADEIKDLAERTSFSTKEIATLIQNVQKELREAVEAMNLGLTAVDEGLKLSREASAALNRIIEKSQNSVQMASEIENSTAEQTRAIRYITETVEKFRDMAGQIAKATAEQSRGMTLLMEASERVRDVATQVKTATEEQSHQSKMIRESTESVSEKSQLISNAINEQQIGTEQIKSSLDNIIDIPSKNRNIAFKINSTVKSLASDIELVVAEMNKFKLVDLKKNASTMRFGVVPLESPAEMHKRFLPLVNYLSRKTGKKFDLKVAVDFEGAINDIGMNETQVAYMTPSTYIKANKKYGCRVIAKALRDGKPYHHSVIITSSSSNINSIEELKGRSFAFGDPESTSSYIVPRFLLLQAGIDLNDLHYYNFLGHHDDVARAVLEGQYDAGAVMESVAEKYKEKGLRFLKYSDEIPEFCIVVSRETPQAEVERIKETILSINDRDPESVAILKSIDTHYTGFTTAYDNDFEDIRHIMSKLEIL